MEEAVLLAETIAAVEASKSSTAAEEASNRERRKGVGMQCGKERVEGHKDRKGVRWKRVKWY